MSNFFLLTKPEDLREKLRRDLEKLKAAPTSIDAAYNFFVTAEHMLDWVYPGKAKKDDRTKARKDSILLEICSHLANGAKHFQVEDKRHKSVGATKQFYTGMFPPGMFPPSMFPPSAFGGSIKLIVELMGDAAIQLGPTIGVVELAERVMDFWSKHSLN